MSEVSPMARMTRREYIQLCAAMGVPVSAQILAACGDDGGGGGGGTDAGDAGMGTDSGSDVGADAVEDTIEIPDLPEYEYDGEPGPADMFQHGVASGDPLTDAVILWTRCTEDGADEIPVWWEISLDAEFTQRLAVGETTTDASRDFTVKVDASGLVPGRTFYYRFFAKGVESPIGRTRTAPEGGVDRLRVAFVSCSSFAHGYFHVYQSLAQQADLDVILHLGDYIYEYGDGQYGDVRTYDPPHEILTLEDYRRRYRHYRADADLQEAHRQHPFICVWDDHESTDNSWPGGANNHQENEGDWETRKAASIQTYFEWLPIREQDEEGKIWRRFNYGELLDLFMLDTRLWGREEEGVNINDPEVSNPERQLLGADQEAWLAEQFQTSTATWKFLGQQVMFGQLVVGAAGLNPDQWDGYPAARERVFDMIENNAADNVVVLTGDIHSTWAMDLTRTPQDADAYDPESGDGAIAVEFVVPAITSPALESLSSGGDLIYNVIYSSNPHIKYVELSKRGYWILDVTADRLHADLFHFEDIRETETEEYWVLAYDVQSGVPHIVETDGPLTPPTGFDLAP